MQHHRCIQWSKRLTAVDNEGCMGRGEGGSGGRPPPQSTQKPPPQAASPNEQSRVKRVSFVLRQKHKAHKLCVLVPRTYVECVPSILQRGLAHCKRQQAAWHCCLSAAL